jgi:sugar transferase (PEP-CTERM/EpsH1 system associated)
VNVLFLTQRLPFAPDRGDRIRAYYLLRAMSGFSSVTLFSFVHDDDEEARVDRVPFASAVASSRVTRRRNLIRGAMRLLSDVPLTHLLLDAPDAIETVSNLFHRTSPDVIVAFGSGMARLALTAPLDLCPMVLDFVDVDSSKWAALAAESRGPKRYLYRREARTLGRFEASAALRARHNLVVNDRERCELIRLAPTARIATVENGIEVQVFARTAPPQPSSTVVFCGVLNYEPNDRGARWFAEHVWPRVRRRRSDARFVIVGPGATSALWRLADSDSSIEMTGRVHSIQQHLWRSALAVAPLHLARGIQNKVLEALAADLPVVVTPVVHEGLPPEARPGCAVADSAEDFAAAVCQLLDMDEKQRTQFARRAELTVLTWATRLAGLEAILREANVSTLSR